MKEGGEVLFLKTESLRSDLSMVLKRLQEVDMLLELSPCLSSIVVTTSHSRRLMNTRYTATNVDMQLASHPDHSWGGMGRG